MSCMLSWRDAGVVVLEDLYEEVEADVLLRGCE